MPSKAKSKRRTKAALRRRTQIAQQFRALDNGQVHATDILRDVPLCLYRVRVFDVVRRFPHMGSDGAENVLRHARVWPLVRMGDLTPEERSAILTHLPPRARR